MTETDKVLELAVAEIGYLEKRSNNDLYDKTANAGSGNYTKYWADIKPSYQGQPWCAAFVTWCMAKALGESRAALLLKHYPFVYCPTGVAMAKAQGRWSRTPSKGAVIIFCNSSGVASHTGLIYAYDDNYVYTIEGNTSAGSTVISNGGAVCRKSYSHSYSRILGYWALDYESIESEDELMSKEYEELKRLIESKDEIINKIGAEIADLKNPMIYNYIDENMPDYYRPTIQKLVGSGKLKGNENGELMLTEDMMRILTILDRTGVFN